MNILLLSRYGHLGASSRVRLFQYIPYLEERGIRVKVAALFSDDYLRHYYHKGRKSLKEIAASYLARVWQLITSSRFDLLWMEKELFPYLPSLAEKLLKIVGKPFVVDYDDAVYHIYDNNPNPIIRLILGKKIDAVMVGASTVVAGNEYIAARARRAGAEGVACIPSTIDLDRYHVAPAAGGSFTIGWIGSPSGSAYLKLAEEPLAEVCGGGVGRVVLVGAEGVHLAGVPVEMHAWSEATEVPIIQSFNVGIMPLPDTPWERGKCGFKLIQYMACGVPVVASRVGMNTTIVDDGVNGFLVSTADQWAAALKTLRDDPALCRRMGAAGRAKVEAEYSLQVTAPQIEEIMLRAIRG